MSCDGNINFLHAWCTCVVPVRSSPKVICVSRALRGGRGKEEPLSVIAMVLQAAPGDDDLPPPGPPRHTSAAQCLTTRTREASPCAGYPAHESACQPRIHGKRGPRAWHTGVRQTAQRLGDRGRTSSRATQRHQPLARRTSLRPPVGTSARRGRTAQCCVNGAYTGAHVPRIWSGTSGELARV